MADNEIRFQITRFLGILDPVSKGGWTKELNLVSWNDREPKVDIRDWSPDHTRMGKGVTLTREEAEKLHAFLGTWLAETSSPL